MLADTRATRLSSSAAYLREFRATRLRDDDHPSMSCGSWWARSGGGGPAERLADGLPGEDTASILREAREA
jgi:hypothetical protein